jgi:hypothetical protein
MSAAPTRAQKPTYTGCGSFIVVLPAIDLPRSMAF